MQTNNKWLYPLQNLSKIKLDNIFDNKEYMFSWQDISSTTVVECAIGRINDKIIALFIIYRKTNNPYFIITKEIL